ncbi:hypothetical protein MVEN_00002400 [Mycena venus]|uniref:Uncharacterized protein n=1 Tax=Mycena venus TaxID=2733690 RepID=A0A8H6Z2M1_9AGAR|nr:hypothetical protein MVEN_00002400 [Mycena venus]
MSNYDLLQPLPIAQPRPPVLPAPSTPAAHRAPSTSAPMVMDLPAVQTRSSSPPRASSAARMLPPPSPVEPFNTSDVVPRPPTPAPTQTGNPAAQAAPSRAFQGLPGGLYNPRSEDSGHHQPATGPFGYGVHGSAGPVYGSGSGSGGS